MLKVLIADDHDIVRKGLRRIIAEGAGPVSIDEANNGREALDRVAQNVYDVVLLDISMPDLNGLYVLKQVRAEQPGLAVIILSMHPEEQYAVRALRAGAAAYLTKESAPEELLTAVRMAVQGKRYVSSSLAEQLSAYIEDNTGRPLHQTLSDREFQVLCLIASGKTVGEVADLLALSVKTVSTYRTRILEKLCLRNNAELTLYAIQNRLVE